MRNVLGGLVALIGAAATLISPWQAWYNNRHGSSYKFYEVFGTGITVSRSGIMDSVFLVFLVTAILAVAGLVLRSRALVLAAGVVALGFTILWMVRQGQAAGELTITGANNRGLGSGLAWAFGGGLLMIIGALMMTGRPKPAATADRAAARPAAEETAQRTGSTRAMPTGITTTAPADKNRQVQPPAPAQAPTPSGSQEPAAPESTPASTQTQASGAERTGTERLSKEERKLLGLDEEAPAQQPPKSQS